MEKLPADHCNVATVLEETGQEYGDSYSMKSSVTGSKAICCVRTLDRHLNTL